jgi:hypothetical protein
MDIGEMPKMPRPDAQKQRGRPMVLLRQLHAFNSAQQIAHQRAAFGAAHVQKTTNHETQLL